MVVLSGFELAYLKVTQISRYSYTYGLSSLLDTLGVNRAASGLVLWYTVISRTSDSRSSTVAARAFHPARTADRRLPRMPLSLSSRDGGTSARGQWDAAAWKQMCVVLMGETADVTGD